MEQTTVNQRLNLLVDTFEKGVKAAFARKAGISPQGAQELLAGRKGDPSFKVLVKILESYPTVDANWLTLGIGEMLKPEEWVDPFASTTPKEGVEKRSVFSSGYLEEYTKREKERRDKAYEEYYAALQKQEQTRNAVKALIEHLAAKDPDISGLLTLLPSAFEDIMDPDTREQLEDAEWDRRMNEEHADQEAEWNRERRAREGQH